MPKKVRMPKLEEVPIHHPEPDRTNQHGHVGWFVRGFAAAVFIFGVFMAYQGHLANAVAGDDEPRTIIEGN